MASDRHPLSDSAAAHCTDVARFLRILHAHGDVFEVRSPKCPNRRGGSYRRTASGYFDDPDAAAAAVAELEAVGPPAVYVTVNPAGPALLARSSNRIKHDAGSTTADDAIVSRRTLFVDIDPKRPAGVSSTDAEVDSALRLARTMRDELAARGWPDPLVGMSGNGAYLLYRVDLPNDAEAGGLVARVLEALKAEFQTEAVDVDTTAQNPARICKVLGSVARKGDDYRPADRPESEHRPHRQSWFEPPSGPLEPVPNALLLEMAEAVEATPTGNLAAYRDGLNGRGDFSIDDWLAEHCVPVGPAESWPGGGAGARRWLFADLPGPCGSSPSGHDCDGGQSIRQHPNGAISAGCHHNHCVWQWEDLRRAYEPGWMPYGERVNGKPEAASRAPGGDGPSGDRGASAGGGDPWPESKPLPADRPPAPFFDNDLLPESLRPWVADIAERMQCPPDFPAVAAMVALSVVVGTRVGIRPKRRDDWLVVPNLWGAVVGRPSMMKSPAIREPLKQLRRLELLERERFAEAFERYERDKLKQAAQEKALKAELGKAAKAGDDAELDRLAAELRKLREDSKPPICRRYVVNDATIEKLGELLSENPDGLLLYRDELTGWLYSFEREDRAADRAAYLELWDGLGTHVTDRIGRGTIEIPRAALSLIGSIQPGPLRAFLSDAARGGRGDDGLVQRLQLAVWPDAPDNWQRVDRYPETEARREAAFVFDRLAQLDAEAAGAEHDGDAPLPFVRFDDDGQQLFYRWWETLERRLRTEGLPEVLESHLAKYRSLMPSLALLVQMADVGRGPVGSAAAQKAVRWCEYLEGHACRLYASAINPDHDAARLLAVKIGAGELGESFALRDVYRNGWSGLTERDVVRSAAELLVDLDWLREEREPTQGRARTRYAVNPKVYGSVGDPTAKTDKRGSAGASGGFVSDLPGASAKKPADDVPADRARRKVKV